MWLGIFFLVILKIPVLYVCWVVWWAIKAEPEVGTQGGDGGLSAIDWRPWRRPPGSRTPRGGPHGGRARKGARAARSRDRTPSS